AAPTFRARAEAVAVQVVVHDKAQPVTGLTEADFELTDNGVRQAVATASLAAVPIDVTIVLDTSGSVEGLALAQFKTDVQAMNDRLATSDRIRLICFADAVSDVFGLQPAGTKLPLDAITGGGMTQLYTALAAALVMTSGIDRPQLVLAFTDGRDSESYADADRILSLAPFSAGSVYLVLSESTSSSEMRASELSSIRGVIYSAHGAFAGGPNRSALRALAQRTGGTLYERPAGEALPTIFQKLLADFRTGYVLTYIPTGVPRGGWHEIRVQSKNPVYTIRARDGYDGGR
ncbi:MAG TPA: VWA domain-containing protein, partial [Vicinamibacterales bacterium]